MASLRRALKLSLAPESPPPVSPPNTSSRSLSSPKAKTGRREGSPRRSLASPKPKPKSPTARDSSRSKKLAGAGEKGRSSPTSNRSRNRGTSGREDRKVASRDTPRPTGSEDEEEEEDEDEALPTSARTAADKSESRSKGKAIAEQNAEDKQPRARKTKSPRLEANGRRDGGGGAGLCDNGNQAGKLEVKTEGGATKPTVDVVEAQSPLKAESSRAAAGGEGKNFTDKHGEPLLPLNVDFLADGKWRCTRSDGRYWRCLEPALPGKNTCEKHYTFTPLSVEKERPLKRRPPVSVVKLERDTKVLESKWEHWVIASSSSTHPKLRHKVGPATRRTEKKLSTPSGRKLKNADRGHDNEQLEVERFLSQYEGGRGNRFQQWQWEIRKRLIMEGGTNAADDHDNFCTQVLQGEGGPMDCYHTIDRYLDMLQEIYGDLVICPHILDAKEIEWDCPYLRHFRKAQRRFIVYRNATDSGKWRKLAQSLWTRVTGFHTGKTYGETKPDEDALKNTCAIEGTIWSSGVLKAVPLADEEKLVDVLDELQSKRPTKRSPQKGGRLFLVDATLPNYEERGVPGGTPGICCAVNDAVNSVLPAPLRTSRPTSFLDLMKVESPGTASWTLSRPLGPGPCISAFQEEMKKRRALSLGFGDLVIQPLATGAYAARLERVHALLTDNHIRGRRMLPLEMYLEEEIPLVIYHRRGPHSELIEFPEQSCHACISYLGLDSPQAALPVGVACNDWDGIEELISAYLLEKLQMIKPAKTNACEQLVTSCFLPKKPNKLEDKKDWLPPWRENGQAVDDQQEEDSDGRMENIIVRTAERMLDALQEPGRSEGAGSPRDDSWTDFPVRLSLQEKYECVRNLLPALKDMVVRKRSKVTRVTSGIHFDIDYLGSVLTECHNFCERYEGGEMPEYSTFERYMNERYNLLCISSNGEEGLQRAHQISEEAKRAAAEKGLEKLNCQELHSLWLLSLQLEWEAHAEPSPSQEGSSRNRGGRLTLADKQAWRSSLERAQEKVASQLRRKGSRPGSIRSLECPFEMGTVTTKEANGSEALEKGSKGTKAEEGAVNMDIASSGHVGRTGSGVGKAHKDEAMSNQRPDGLDAMECDVSTHIDEACEDAVKDKHPGAPGEGAADEKMETGEAMSPSL